MTPDEEMTLLHYARVATGFAWNKQVPTQYKTDHPRCVFCCSEEDRHNDPWEVATWRVDISHSASPTWMQSKLPRS